MLTWSGTIFALGPFAKTWQFNPLLLQTLKTHTMNMIIKLCLKVRKNNIIIMKKKSFIYSFYVQPFQAFQFSYHSMKWTDMIDKSKAVAGRDHAIHVSLTVRSQYIPNGKWMISVLYLDDRTNVSGDSRITCSCHSTTDKLRTSNKLLKMHIFTIFLLCSNSKTCVCLIWFFTSTQHLSVMRDVSSWVEPVLS